MNAREVEGDGRRSSKKQNENGRYENAQKGKMKEKGGIDIM